MPTPWQTSCTLGVLHYVYHRHYKDNTFLRERLMRDRFSMAKTLTRKHLKGHFGCVNAIEFSNDGGGQIVSGGDDRRVLLWNVEEGISGIAKPVAMKGDHHSNIFCLAFDNSNKQIFSGGNDQQVLVHDAVTGQTKDVFNHEDAVYGLSVDPLNDNVFASACDDGRILIYDIREPASEDPFCLANYMSQMHAVMYNPAEPRLLATANSKEGVGLWDIRKPRSCLLRYGGSLSAQSCMSVRINRRGDQVIALRRRLPPVLYSLGSPLPVFHFDHVGYYNSCTMKSCCFAGDNDQYLISGSDDFNLYVWRIPAEPTDVPWVGEAHLVLKGHRSIVNQVRFNPSNNIMISSGVEKVIKIWSPFTLPDQSPSELGPDSLPDPSVELGNEVGDSSSVQRSEEERPVYTHEEYINLVLHSGQVMSHDYSHQSTEEDPRMMAFFDSLVQREMEGYTTEDDSLESNSDLLERLVQPSHSDNSESGRGDQSHSDDDGGYSPFTIAFASAMANRAQNEERNSETDSGGNLLDMDSQGATSARPASELPEGVAEEASNGEAVSGVPILPGQRHISGRRSISELITQKRKEYRYLSNAQKALPKPCKRLKLSKASCASATCADQDDSSGSSSTSETDSDSSTSTSSNGHTPSKSTRRKLRKRFKRKSSSSSSDSASEDFEGMRPSQVAKIRNIVSVNKRIGLQRLKRMRERVLNSDSDSQEASCPNKMNVFTKLEPSTNSATNGCVGHSEPTPSTSAENSSFLVMLEATSDQSNSDASGPEIGPFLSDALVSQNGTTTDQDPESVPPNVKAGSNICDGLSNGNDAFNCACVPGACKDKAITNGYGDNHENSASNRRNGDETTTKGATGSSVSSVTPKGDIPWIEFKRFENRVERARRQYRKRHQDKSSGDDGS